MHTRLHATSVAIHGQGVLIRGASGSGKSSLALQLMALGAQLISDDQTELRVDQSMLHARAPASIRGLIEARGIGLLHAEAVEATIRLVIDLDQIETQRLPYAHQTEILGCTLPCLHKAETDAWPAGVLQYVKGGRREP
ncbi:HPr kinase/phosphatase C-terminal domain-containing protein [uncultured Tateyamaria sp.]|uniref:HPr kinase/phosphorylase n=1 Tax=uncultured Tateyamaria sp. TaxID=455651 RepID=UPI0026308B5E|nr:HPr kinase/phosphatase C-terminal domain-containing protein [uncultured Tateyamaria sp.]